MLTKHTLFFGFFIGGALIVSLVALGAMLHLIDRAKEKHAQRQTEIAKELLHEQELVALEKLVIASTKERASLDTYILKDDAVIDFLSLIGALAGEQGVVHEIPSLDTADIDRDFEELLVEVTLKGEYDPVTHMLELLETLPYQSYIETVDISRASKDGGAQWSATLMLHVVKHKKNS